MEASAIVEAVIGWTGCLSGLLPGAYVVVRNAKPEHCLEGRRAGLEFRDTIMVVAAKGSSMAALFRVPLTEKTVVSQILATGTSALNIDACRTGSGSERTINHYLSVGQQGCINRPGETAHAGEAYASMTTTLGRWPTNLVLVHQAKCQETEGVWTCALNCPAATLSTQTRTSDDGGNARFYPQFADDATIVAWLTTLIRPKSNPLKI